MKDEVGTVADSTATNTTASQSVVVGVAGGIAAYKVCSVVRGLAETGLDVRVIPTPAACEFVGVATWEALSGKPAHTDVWDDVPGVGHVAHGQGADVMVVAPATADLLARAAAGMADDLLTSTLLVASCPVVMFPAMHTEMWHHPATQDNVATLRRRGVIVVTPASGRLTGADSGLGRLPEPEQIVLTTHAVAASGDRLVAHQMGPWHGLHVVVSAGGTQEALDPVRVLTNRSSGKQGAAMAAVARAWGAQVTLVATDNVVAPAGVDVVRVSSAAEMAEQMNQLAEAADVIVMAAAVSDYRPVRQAEHKMKKSGDGGPVTLELAQNDDILVGLVRRRDAAGQGAADQTIVGFAAETGSPGQSVMALAQTKLVRKGCDVLVVNSVAGGAVFGQDTTDVTLLTADGDAVPVAAGSKISAAVAIADCVSQVRGVQSA